MKKKSSYFFYGLTAIVICGFLYYTSLAFSDSKIYSKYSAEYLFLTPPELKNFPLSQASTISYYYSAADGNKCTIYALRYTSNSSQREIEQLFEDYFLQLGYIQKNRYEYYKENSEASLSMDRHDDSSQYKVDISILEITH